MDPTDRRILAILARDGAITAAQLGERVGLSTSAAHRRMKQLETRGLITGYRARLSPEARGHPRVAFVSVTLKDQTLETLSRFEEAVRRCAEVEEAHLMTGDSDFLLKVAVREDDNFERVHRDILARLPGVQRLISQFSIRTVVEGD